MIDGHGTVWLLGKGFKTTGTYSPLDFLINTFTSGQERIQLFRYGFKKISYPFQFILAP
jgi:hypothetical protein